MSVIKTSEGWQRAWGDQESGKLGENRRLLVRPCGSTGTWREMMRVKDKSGCYKSGFTASFCYFFSLHFCHMLHVFEIK